MSGGGLRIHWVLRDADTLSWEPPWRGGSWFVAWPSVPVNPSPRRPERIVTWSLLAYLAFAVAREAGRGEEDAARVLAGLAAYRERVSRGLESLYPVRGHRLWVRLARCPEGGLAPLVRSPRVRLPDGSVYGVHVDYSRDGEPIVEVSLGEGEATVEGGKVRCPGGSLAPLDSVVLEGRILVAVAKDGGVERPGSLDAKAVERARRAYLRGAPQLEALGLLPGRPRRGLSWLSRRGVERLHEVYPERAALAAAYTLREARGPGELLAALVFAAAVSPWARPQSGGGFTLSLSRVRPDTDLHWEVDPLSWEGLLGAVETVAMLAALWGAAGGAPEPVYASPWDPEATVEELAVAPPRPLRVERALLAEDVASHWAPPGLEPPPVDAEPLEAAATSGAERVLVGGPPGSGWVASAAGRLLEAGYTLYLVEALLAYGPRASWLGARRREDGPAVLDAELALTARSAGRLEASRAARAGAQPGVAIDKGASRALEVLTASWPLRRPDGSAIAVKTVLTLALSGALEGLAEAYTGSDLDGPSRLYLALRLIGPLPRGDAELLAAAAGESLSRLMGLVKLERSGVVRARPLTEIEPGETWLGSLVAAARSGEPPSEALCRLAEAIASARPDGDERLLAKLAARCRGVSIERWILGGAPQRGAPA